MGRALATLLAVSISSAVAARADSRESRASVVLLAPNADEQGAFLSHARAGIEGAHLSVVVPSEDGVEPRLLACRVSACLGEVAAQARASFALLVRVTVTDGLARAVTAQLSDARGVSVERSVEVRAGDVARAIAEAVAAAKLALSLGGDALLRVRTAPTGALVFVDGAVGGSAPSELRVAPGKHAVTVTLHGFVGDERQIDAVGGEAATVDITLTPAAVTQTMSGDARPSPWNYVAFAGLAVLSAPLMAWPLDVLASDGRCDSSARCAGASDFGAGHAVMLGGGVALLSLGAYFLLATPIALGAEVSSDRAALSLAGAL